MPRWWVLLASLAAGLACAGPPKSGPEPNPPPPTEAAPTSGLVVPPDVENLSKNPGALQRIRQSAHGYFRFVNIPFSNEVCRRFKTDIPKMPTVNLHGDAHLEQYSITDHGRGLGDFDDSSRGPVVLDLVRFATSIELAARANGWGTKSDELVDAFLSAYREALENPKVAADEPACSKRVRGKFDTSRAEFFRWINEISQPIDEREKQGLIRAFGAYVEAMVKDDETLTPAFFEVLEVGRPKVGIGSALDRKYLMRIRGKTESAEDDEILEVKQVRDLSPVECLQGTENPFRILVGKTRISYEPYRLLGYLVLDEAYFWVHAWVRNYHELVIDESFGSEAELEQVARDVGIQLGKGHPKYVAQPLDAQLRREMIKLLDRYAPKVKQTSKELADESTAAWTKFRSETDALAKKLGAS